ncbi:8-amino-7-oxononanoate synthase [Parabacteroides sp. OttesenSCG-928-G06]|nr:8-amino-7-oxononanoate synthase [Parabacteroides sp. OttesenSCG-928-K15]MDL2282305.1 8-amino-7-oxononanoate synthase [Parabacteroides sp. OttesenSCG-928-G06]
MKDYQSELMQLQQTGNLRSLPDIVHDGEYIIKEGRRMLNLSSNDYLGLAGRKELRAEFLEDKRSNLPFSSSSSRLLTGNYAVYNSLERLLAERFEREAALLFNSGYHANIGILPALADKQTLIVADKLVHASLIDGIRLSQAPFLRYRHNDYDHLERILIKEAARYTQVIVVTESVFSMDGDKADLPRLVALKRDWPNLLLYVDEAHAVGVFGNTGLGVAEEAGYMAEVDLLVGTFGKALASMGAYVVCDRVIREYLINRMRPLIFSTALPPIQIAWTEFVFEKLPEFDKERRHLSHISRLLRESLHGVGGERSESHIVPYILGESQAALDKAAELQSLGYYALAVRPPTVPVGTARIRFSLMASTSPPSPLSTREGERIEDLVFYCSQLNK